MAGPGGGPPRRSHTKSRKGCDTCKRRHIRCDESFPQCRNCTKHKIRCPYNDVPVMEDRATPDKADLMWTPEIENAINQWRQTGVFPFPNLGIFPAPAPQTLSVEDARLLYHVASICDQLTAVDANNFSIWTRQMPTIIKISATHRYVLHSLLAFSAMHIAWLTDCPLVGNMSYEYRGMALNGLQEAIGSFSRDTSDAVLAASLVLSWQATDWRGWTQLMQGTSTVIDAMEEWAHESQFGDFIVESSTFPTAPPSPTPDHRPHQPSKEDLDAYQETLQQLQKVEAYLKQTKQDPKPMQQLIGFLRGSRKVSPTLSVAQQFERLRPLRTWMFWLPVLYLTDGAPPNALVIIAHYYTVALLMERLFPEIGAAYFGSLSIGPIEDIARRLFSINISGVHEGSQVLLSLMEFPVDAVNDFRSRRGWSHPARTPSFPQFHAPGFTTGDLVPLPPVTEPSYLPYGENLAFSYSTESLAMLNSNAESSAQGGSVSGMALSSPYNSHQYLSIPSPSYGAYSPASSTFEGSMAYSDTEDYLPESMPNMLGSAHHNLGVGMSTTSLFTVPGDHPALSASPLTAPQSHFLRPEHMIPLPESPHIGSPREVLDERHSTPPRASGSRPLGSARQ